MSSVLPLVQAPEHDTANFYVEDVIQGSLLRFYGHSARTGMVYRVAGFYAQTGRWFAKPRARWRAPTDVVRMISLDGREVRNLNLTYITYSALWHLVDEA